MSSEPQGARPEAGLGPSSRHPVIPSSRQGFRLPALSGPILGLVIVATVFVVLVGLRGDLRTFLSVANGQVLLHGNLVTGVAALGALLVIISGGIDLSVGSV